MGGGSSAEIKKAETVVADLTNSPDEVGQNSCAAFKASVDVIGTENDEEIDRSEIERNANGCEEPSSSDPELWNIDNCEVDILVKYKMGGQMWYVQSRMRENTAKDPPKPIPGFPMNRKAHAAKRYYCKDDDEFNVGSANCCDAAQWKLIEAKNPPVVKA